MATATPDREGDLRDILKAVLDRMKTDFGMTDEEVAQGVSSVVESFKNNFSYVNYDHPQNVYGYLSRYGMHGASMTRQRVLEAASAHEELKKTLREGEGGEMTVISLGGGPGNDALGFCSALADLGFPADRRLDVIVADQFGGWKEYVDRMIPVVKEGPFGNLTDLFQRDPFTMSFVHKDILSHESARAADIVLMQKVLTSLQCAQVHEVTEKIHRFVKPGGFVFLIDSKLESNEDGQSVYYCKGSKREPIQNLQLIHLSERGEFFGGTYSGARLALLRRPRKRKAEEENQAAAKKQKKDSPKNA